MLYKNIMVAIDGSETSVAALREAISLAKVLQAKLNLTYILDVDVALNGLMMSFDYAPLIDACKAEAEKILQNAIEKAQQEKITCEKNIVLLNAGEGTIAEKIAEEAKKGHADLLVVGTHGRRGVSRLLLGSVAEGILRAASMPVLLIRAQ